MTDGLQFPVSRRDFLRRSGCGFGSIALTALLAEQGLLASSPVAHTPGSPHHAPRAKRVIFLFMSGGPSHLETFEPKPDLQRLHGQPLPPSFGPVKTRRGVDKNRLLATKRKFTKHGRGGIDVSDLLPNLAACADDLCVLRGCHGDSVTHPESVYLMNTGSILMGRPSLGAWASYGLGTENRNHARIRGAARSSRLGQGRRSGLGQRLSTVRLSRHDDPWRLGPGAALEEPTGRVGRSATANSRPHQPAERTASSGTGRRLGPVGPHRRLRVGVPDAEARPRSGGPRARNSGNPAAIRPRSA